MLRRFLLALLIFLLIVVVVADRVGALVAAHVLAGNVQTDENLTNRPTVSIKGIPFLTQAFGGKYHDVRLTDHGVLVNEVPITTLTVDLRGLHLSLGKALHGSVSQVPVDHVTGTAFVSFSDANSYLAHHLPAATSIRIAPGPNRRTVAVVDRVRLGGHRFTLRGNGEVTVSNNVVAVDVAGLTPGATAVAAPLLSRALAKAPVSFPLQALPFQLKLTAVTVTTSGLSGAGRADDVVLGSHQT
jgi:DUF2993 family protein